MNLRPSLAIPVVAFALATAHVVACSQGDGAAREEASSAASPLVQSAGVSRIRSQVEGNVTHVALLDEGGKTIGSLDLTIEGPKKIHAALAFAGQTLDATWTEQAITFARDAKAFTTVPAGKAPHSAEIDAALLDATKVLNVAAGVARDLGMYSPMEPEVAGAVTRPLDLGTGSTDAFRGSDWEWGTGSDSYLLAYQQSRVSAYNGCVSVWSSGTCAAGSSSNTYYTSCSYGYYSVTCNTTISVNH